VHEVSGISIFVRLYGFYRGSLKHPDKNNISVELIEGTILENMKVVAEKAKDLGAEGVFPYDYLEDLIRDKKRVDNLLVLSHQVLNPREGQNELSNLLNKYCSEVNPDILFVSVDLSGSGRSTMRTINIRWIS